MPAPNPNPNPNPQCQLFPLRTTAALSPNARPPTSLCSANPNRNSNPNWNSNRLFRREADALAASFDASMDLEDQNEAVSVHLANPDPNPSPNWRRCEAMSVHLRQSW